MAITVTENAAKHIRDAAREARRRGPALRREESRLLGLCLHLRLRGRSQRRTTSCSRPTTSTVVVDKDSLEFLDGSTLDFVREGLKESFKFENPNAKAMCGCGESFTRRRGLNRIAIDGAARERSHPEPGQPALQARLRHRHRVGRRAEGAERRHDPADLGEEERAGVAARVPAEGLSPLADDERADVAERQVPEDRLPGHQLLLGAEAEEEARSPWTRSIRSCCAPSRSSACR